MRRALFAVIVAGLAAPVPASAQSAAELLQRAYVAYQNLDLPTTVGLIQRAFAAPATDTSVSRRERARALSILAAAEFFRNRRDSATSAFRQLVQVSPRYRPDPATFPPPVLLLFDDVRRAVKVVELSVPDSAEVRLGAGGGAYPVQAYASSLHPVEVHVYRSDGRAVRELYRGLLGDSLAFAWNGTDSAGAPVTTGTYYLSVLSQRADGGKLRELRLPLDIQVVRRDTVPHPGPLADSLFKAERQPRGPAFRALAGGVLLGAGAAAMPTVIGGSDGAAGSRFLVGVALTGAGVAGLITRHPGQPIREHIAYNDSLRGVWRARVDQVISDNGAARQDVRLKIRARPAVRIDEVP